MAEVDLVYSGLTIRLPRQEPGCFYTTCLLGEYDRLRIRPGDIVLDAGANVGDFTVLAAKKAGKSGVVVAVEPNALSRGFLLYNVKCNGLTNVKVVDSFISGSEGFVGIEDFGTYSERSDRTGNRQERQQTIDDILESLSLPRLDILKMDIEGEEVNALRGQRFLATLRELCVEVHGGTSEHVVLEILKSEGFDLQPIGWRTKLGKLVRSGIPGAWTVLGTEIRTHGYASRFVTSAMMNRSSGAGRALTGNKVYYGTRT